MTVMSDFVRGMRLPLSPCEIAEGESISKGRRTVSPIEEPKYPGSSAGASTNSWQGQRCHQANATRSLIARPQRRVLHHAQSLSRNVHRRFAGEMGGNP